ncbi:hypothetical protein JHK87_020705 [Glycine soja]|nr:hypothetical protein JHK87_020705 [Glycine soja]
MDNSDPRNTSNGIGYKQSPSNKKKDEKDEKKKDEKKGGKKKSVQGGLSPN